MSNLLARALGLPDTSLNRFTEQLEDASGYPSEDARLTSDLIAANCLKISQLGLDSSDTTAPELYQALLATYQQASQALARSIGQSDDDSLVDNYQRINTVLARQAGQPVWMLKRAELKKLLAKTPPRRLMKHLKYRTAQSLLKREDVRLLFLVGQRVESLRWRKQVSKAIANLPPTGFEKLPAQAVVLPVELWSGLDTKRPLVVCQPEVGTVAVWPNALAKKITTLGVVTLALTALDTLSSWSTALDYHPLDPNFAKRAAAVWSQTDPVALEIVGRPITWRSLSSDYLRQLSSPDQSETIGLLESSDRLADTWSLRRSLIQLHVLINWWADNQNLIYVDSAGQAVSLNLSDVVANHALKAPFSKRSLNTARQALFDELVWRYLNYPGVVSLVLSRLAGESKDAKANAQRFRPQLVHQLGNG